MFKSNALKCNQFEVYIFRWLEPPNHRSYKTCKLPLKKLSTMCVHINLIAPIAANGSSGSYVIYLKSSIQSSFILNEREKKTQSN